MKHEKYIQEKKNAKGETYFRIYIPYKDEYGVPQKPISRNVKAKDYESVKVAFNVAKLIRDKLLVEISNHTYKSQYPTIKYLIDHRNEYMQRTIRTQQTYTALYKSMSQFYDVPINKITTADLQLNVNKYAETHSDNRISKYLSTWKSLYMVCNMMDIPIVDKTKQIVKPKSQLIAKKRSVVFSENDFQRLLSLLDNYETSSVFMKYRCIMLKYTILIGYYTGMRPAEIFALNSDDITDSTIKVWKSVGSTSNEHLTLKRTKTASSIRYIPIHDELKPILENLKNFSQHSPLITEYDGSLANIMAFSCTLRTICKANNISFHLYDLRHAFATDLIQSGNSPRTVQDLMGHASFNMSVEYARSSESDRKEAVNNIKKNTTKQSKNTIL